MAFPEAPSVGADGRIQASGSAAPETSSDRDLDTTSDSSTPDSSEQSSAEETREIANAIAELDKLEKFKFRGEEYTPKDLERAILRQKDYTQKTQKFAEERKAWETSRKDEEKFSKNLSFDIQNVIANPSLAAEFIRVYPEKYHATLRDALNKLEQIRGQGQGQQEATPRGPSREYLEQETRLQKLERFYHEQETAKNTQEINSQVERLSAKYKDAVPEIAIANIFEQYNQTGEKPTAEAWEAAFKSADDLFKAKYKANYGEKIKQQAEANAKGRADDAGGGTVARAPTKPKSFKEATEWAIRDLKRKG